MTKTKRSYPVSPLRYPGAKRWMVDYIARSIRQNGLKPDVFVEPFTGGASVSLAMLHSGLVEKVVLNDRDPLVASFWKTLFFDTEWLIEATMNADVTIDTWRHLKQRDFKSARDRAFKCLFLNRTSFSGILASNAGPIGGQCQSGTYKIDCRFNKEGLVGRIEKAAKFNGQVEHVWNLDWHVAMKRVSRSRPRDEMFSYFDPPFFHKAEALYNHSFSRSEHERLRNYLVDLKSNWILSYDHCDEAVELYGGGQHQACDVNLIYRAGRKKGSGIGKEIIVSNLNNMLSELSLGVGRKTSVARDLSCDSLKGIELAFDLDANDIRERAI